MTAPYQGGGSDRTRSVFKKIQTIFDNENLAQINKKSGIKETVRAFGG